MPYNAVKTLDGHIVIDAHLPRFWSSLCTALDAEELENDQRFATLDARNRNRSELLDILNEKFSSRASREWLETLEACDVPCAPINDLRAALNDPATLALNMVVDINHTGVGLKFKASGNPIVFIPIHWAPDAFMSDKQFREFWWPPFRKMMVGLIDAGLIKGMVSR